MSVKYIYDITAAKAPANSFQNIFHVQELQWTVPNVEWDVIDMTVFHYILQCNYTYISA